jgi:hypothetical protein
MAHLVAAMASVHIPSLLAAPQRFTPEVWEKFQQGFGTLRHTLTTAGVDTIVVISDEHFNTLDPHCYPSFGVVTADTALVLSKTGLAYRATVSPCKAPLNWPKWSCARVCSKDSI